MNLNEYKELYSILKDTDTIKYSSNKIEAITSFFTAEAIEVVFDDYSSVFMKLYHYVSLKSNDKVSRNDAVNSTMTFIKSLSRCLDINKKLQFKIEDTIKKYIEEGIQDSNLSVLALKYASLGLFLKLVANSKSPAESALYNSMYVFLWNAKKLGIDVNVRAANWILRRIGCKLTIT